jgi:archaellum biogenesis protein FlaJ (TadC family)
MSLCPATVAASGASSFSYNAMAKDLGLIEGFLLAVNVAYAFAAAAAVRIVQGGRLQGAFTDAAVMLWIAAIVAVASGQIADAIL